MKGLLLTALGVFGVDFWAKRQVEEKLEEGQEIDLLNGHVKLTKHHNSGFAMNLLEDHPKAVKVLHAAVAAIFLYCYTHIVREKGNPARKVGCAFILGGGLSNLCDRLIRGHVVDYIRIPIKGAKALSKIIFNIADVFIAIGTVLVLFGRSRRK